ncbi:MAG: response regulator transcription factor [Anaerolineae bacterium]|nr:response regulator transcription factor [Anaerolineae bacterium]
MVDAPPIRIIVINDQQDVGFLWVRLLNTMPGMACVAFGKDGREALQLAREHRPDVILMDVMMPVMDGLEATRLLKDLYPGLLIIVYSAYLGRNDSAFEAGADEFILMPVHPTRLVETIRRVYAAARNHT